MSASALSCKVAADLSRASGRRACSPRFLRPAWHGSRSIRTSDVHPVASTSMKSFAEPVLVVAVVLVAWAGVAGGDPGWLRGWHGGQSMGVYPAGNAVDRRDRQNTARPRASMRRHRCRGDAAQRRPRTPGPRCAWIRRRRVAHGRVRVSHTWPIGNGSGRREGRSPVLPTMGRRR